MSKWWTEPRYFYKAIRPRHSAASVSRCTSTAVHAVARGVGDVLAEIVEVRAGNGNGRAALLHKHHVGRRRTMAPSVRGGASDHGLLQPGLRGQRPVPNGPNNPCVSPCPQASRFTLSATSSHLPSYCRSSSFSPSCHIPVVPRR
jgi:hypothetical protein